MNPQPTSGIDATKKIPGEGFKRPWPPLIKMDEAVQKKIDALFSSASAIANLLPWATVMPEKAKPKS